MRTAFFIIGFGLVIAFLCLFSHDFKGAQSGVFFQAGGTYLADYHNNVVYSANLTPYKHGSEAPYFPLAYVLMHVVSGFAPYRTTEAINVAHSGIGMASAAMVMLAISLPLFLILSDAVRGDTLVKMATAGLLAMSSVFIFAYERGNPVILAGLMTAMFVFYHDSKDKVARELSLLALAVAAALKGYPALFGVLLLVRGEFLATARLAVYGCAMCFLPFLCLDGGFANVAAWQANFKENNTAYQLNPYGPYARFGHHYFMAHWGTGWQASTMVTFNKVGTMFTYGMTLAMVAVMPWLSNWRKVMAIACAVLILPVNSALYCGVYLFPAIVLFLNERHGWRHTHYFILFLLFLNPLQVVACGVNWTLLACNIAVFVLFFDMLAVGLYRAVRQIWLEFDIACSLMGWGKQEVVQ